MKKTLNLTADHLKLATFFDLQNEEDGVKINKKIMLTEQSHILDDVSLILGLRDAVIPNTEEDADGRAFPDDIEKYMLDTYNYVKDNMYWIETLIHQQILKGGVTPGTYTCDTRDRMWSLEQKASTN